MSIAEHPPHTHGRPQFAKLSVFDGSKVEIALIHPDVHSHD